MNKTEYAAKVDWLSRAFNLDKKIKIIDEKIDLLRSDASSTSAGIICDGAISHVEIPKETA